LAAKHDFEAFALGELEGRKALGYPPFGRLLKILLQGRKEDRVRAAAEGLVLDLRAGVDPKEARILGPAPSPRAYLVEQFRWQALVKAVSPSVVQKIATELEEKKLESGVQLHLDIDPYTLL
jgi:primosomal protein N' (replication factor Y)